MWLGLGAAALLLATPSAAPPPPPVVGLHVPWAAGGLHRLPDGSLTDEPEPWPNVSVPAVRLWDTRTTWADIEPVNDAWSFAHLDRHVEVANSHGTHDILLVLGGTPAWAARDPQAPHPSYLPSGISSPAADLSEWREYVATVAERYRGRITTYQIGNEPNQPMYWSGRPRDLTRAPTIAAEVIHELEPAALVIGAGPVVTDAASVVVAARWWAALRDVPLDAVALQWYPRPGTDPDELVAIIQTLRRILRAHDVRERPIWLTEVNHQTHRSTRPSTLVTQTVAAARVARVSRMYWYAWSELVSPALLPLGATTPAGRALARTMRSLP